MKSWQTIRRPMARVATGIAMLSIFGCGSDPTSPGGGGGGSAPNAPSQLVATTESAAQIALVWTDNADNESGFRVERSTTSSTEGFTAIQTLNADETTHSDTGLSAGTNYWYRLHAYNDQGNSAYSNVAAAKTPQVSSAPAAPGGLSATAVSSNGINLAWTDNSGNENGFRVERSATGASSGFSLIATVGPNVTAYSNTGLGAATTYWYRVRAYNSVGESGPSNTASATTPSGATTPAPPTGLSATASGISQIGLSWTDNADNETGFRIERSTAGASSGFSEIATVGPNVEVYTDTGLTAETTYWYRVLAYNALGNSGYSNTTSATTFQGFSPPAAPSSLIASSMSASQINLIWTDNANNETSFRIERSSVGNGTGFTEIASVGANVTSYSNNGLIGGTTYWFRVRAAGILSGMYSSYSNISSATTSASVATLRIINNSKYYMVDIRLNGTQEVQYPAVIQAGGSADFYFNSSGTVNYDLGVGFWNNTQRDIWFTYRGSISVTQGQVRTLTVNNPTMGQLLTNFQNQQDWQGPYWVNLTPYTATFRFFQTGRWELYDANGFVSSGTVSVVSWPNYAMTVTFRTNSAWGNISLSYPFGIFYCRNGPADWPTIEYVRQ